MTSELEPSGDRIERSSRPTLYPVGAGKLQRELQEIGDFRYFHIKIFEQCAFVQQRREALRTARCYSRPRVQQSTNRTRRSAFLELTFIFR